ncbi:transcriptional repressor LexA [Streptomyces olivoreticuli]
MDTAPAECRPGQPPGTRAHHDGLTDRQESIVQAIQISLQERGYPPSMREIGTAVGLGSTSSVAHQLRVLVKKGVLRKDPHRPRAYAPTREWAKASALTDPPTPGHAAPQSIAHAPVVGRVAVGAPITAEQHVDDVLALPRQLVGSGDLFILTVTGSSMIDAHIAAGDQVVVRAQPDAESGDIVAAMVDGEAAVKRLQHQAGHVWLRSENPAYADIPGDAAVILGKVVAVLRRL